MAVRITHALAALKSRVCGVVHWMPLFELIWTPRVWGGKARSHARRGGGAGLSIEAHPACVETREYYCVYARVVPLPTPFFLLLHFPPLPFLLLVLPFTLASLNRQATAGLADVGMPKLRFVSYGYRGVLMLTRRTYLLLDGRARKERPDAWADCGCCEYGAFHPPSSASCHDKTINAHDANALRWYMAPHAPGAHAPPEAGHRERRPGRV
ncbi:hypothetical protein K438DRAFT_1759306 [Mycena galopus ATCC 62051]|nr:hypothetical protein K438DRAFT_1759306 [Mycena galopus ATCC 62051]